MFRIARDQIFVTILSKQNISFKVSLGNVTENNGKFFEIVEAKNVLPTALKLLKVDWVEILINHFLKNQLTSAYDIHKLMLSQQNRSLQISSLYSSIFNMAIISNI